FEAIVAKKTNERHTEAFGGRDGEARGSADRCKDRNPRGDGLLHHFVSGPTAHREHRPSQRQATVEKRAADDLVDRVVTADVLAKKLELATAVEQPGRVQAPGRFEDALLLTESVRKARQHRGVDRRTDGEERAVERE